MSKIVYQTESFKGIAEELKGLIGLQHKELGVYSDRISVNVMWDKYFELEDVGILKTLTVRDEEKLVGYYVSLVFPHLHFLDEVFSVNDFLFVHPDYRKGFTGIKLLKEAEKQMRELGVSVMTISSTSKTPFDKILDRLGWDFTEKVYSKYLGEN